MARIKIYYRCPICNEAFDTEREATRCKNQHPVIIQRWAIGKSGKGVLINDNCSQNGMYGENWALRECELSDNVYERKKQLEELKIKEGKN